jgi:hypothetical protein
MGMFDWVDFSIKCPLCGEMLVGFQTKDLENQLKTVNYKDTKNFYNCCKNCKTSVHFYKMRNRNGMVTATYKMEVFEEE